MKKQLIIDIAGISGFGLFIYGISQIHKDAAFVVAGLLMMVFALKAKVPK